MTSQQLPPGRVIIVGDVHGCCRELLMLLEKCQFQQSTDALILVGDLVNKGDCSVEVCGAHKLQSLFHEMHGDCGMAPSCNEHSDRLPADGHRLHIMSPFHVTALRNARQVLQTARRLGALAVRGNHDESALAAYAELQRGISIAVSSLSFPLHLPVRLDSGKCCTDSSC